jgi:hypothetical protein
MRDLLDLIETFTNKDEAGRHFTERYTDEEIDALEAAGYIEVTRPVHEPTGIPYSQQYWTAEPTELAYSLFS